VKTYAFAFLDDYRSIIVAIYVALSCIKTERLVQGHDHVDIYTNLGAEREENPSPLQRRMQSCVTAITSNAKILVE
jgi:hypothetical protein